MRHPALWTAPPPFWGSLEQSDPAFLKPRILRFSTDGFMEQVFQTLERDPRELTALEAEPETWRGPSRRSEALGAPEPSAPEAVVGLRRMLRNRLRPPALAPLAPQDAEHPLKLYQSAHKRHYMLAASLVCKRPGLPERSIDKSKQQSVSQVVRRLVWSPPAGSNAVAPAVPVRDPRTGRFDGWTEYAWIPGDEPRWQPLAPGSEFLLEPGEERLPIFQANYRDEHGHRRRLLLGTIPVGRRETYLAAPLAESATDPSDPIDRSVDPRMFLFRSQVTAPWLALAESAVNSKGGFLDAAIGESGLSTEALRTVRGRIQVSSWFVLLDLWDFLQAHGSPAWRTFVAGTAPASSLPAESPERELALHLESVHWTESQRIEIGADRDDLLAALRGIGPWKTVLEDPRHPTSNSPAPRMRPDFDLADSSTFASWPTLRFPLADPRYGPHPGVALDTDGFARVVGSELNRLSLKVAGVLAPAGRNAAPDPVVLAVPGRAREGVWFCMRAAMEHPECLAEHREVLSHPTDPFQMAGFFDADAPARPIRIGLPIDPTPSGLRKFDRNTAFELSDLMCAQVSRMKGITFGDLVLSVLPWPFHKDLPGPGKGKCEPADDMGMMLVLSIPIITICALILLMIIVALLDMVFKWIPLFLLWIPVPRLKGAKDRARLPGTVLGP